MATAAASGFLFANTCSNISFRKSQSPKLSSLKASVNPELGFVTSQLNGVRISYNLTQESKLVSSPSVPSFQPVVARNFTLPLSSWFLLASDFL